MYPHEKADCTESGWVVRVKALMPEKGIHTYQDLAFHSGVSAGSLNQAMRGMHMPRQKTIEKIAMALDTTPQYLLYGDSMKLVQKIPLLRTAELLYQWLGSTPLDVEVVDWLELPDAIQLSKNSFAVQQLHHDMEPVFLFGDTIVFERFSEEKDQQVLLNQSVYVLAIDTSEQAQAQPRQWLFGRYVMTGQGAFISPLNSSYQPIKLHKHFQLIGVAVYLMRDLMRCGE